MSSVDSAAIDLLRAAVRDALSEKGSTTSSPALRRAAQRAAEAARDAGLRVEALLVVVKREWQDLPDADVLPTREVRDRCITQAVSACIEAYYAKPSDTPAAD
jgi:hypothetical protein